jgi:superfamily II DNA or RNA helicase
MIRRRHLKLFGKCYIDPHAAAGVVSVQTLSSRGADKNAELQRWLQQITLAVFDEGHHYVTTGLWAKAVEAMGDARLLFVTATPERADGKGLGLNASGFAEVMVEGPPTQWLIDNGFLARFRYVAPDSDLDVSGLAVTPSGDFNPKALRERIVDSHLVGDCVAHYKKFTNNGRAIVFVPDVETAHEFAAAFNSGGVEASALSGETDEGERDRELERFESGELKVLVNVDLFDEGFDVPQVEVVILARKTESLGKFLQMCGRSFRPVYADGFDLCTVEGRLAAMAASDKPEALIIDPVRNWERHGMPNWPRQWTLEGRSGGGRGSATDTVPQRVCTGCTQPYEAFYVACPYCGMEPVPAERRTPEQVDGDLMELDVEGMAALFEKMQKADMTDEEFGADMRARNVPGIGQARQLRAHRAAKHRRAVLHELVGWWIGAQPQERPMREKHKRFYCRFGIDIGTAHALDEKDTDALIERIQQRFAEDITA